MRQDGGAGLPCVPTLGSRRHTSLELKVKNYSPYLFCMLEANTVNYPSISSAVS